MANNAPIRGPSTFVAIAAKNETGRIGACLRALDQQSQRPDAVILLVNNTSDGTEIAAQTLRPRLRYDLRILSRHLPPALSGAGHARRLAMALAAKTSDCNDILLTTDADAAPPQDWIVRNVAAIANGADAVCGRAVPNLQEAALLPDCVRSDLALEERLRGLLDNLAWILDPEPHDPPPRHTEASGASLAVTTGAFHRAGGIPAVRSGEDRAFLAALWRRDAKLRHDPSILVSVSARFDGRASGGMAETLRRRMLQRDMHADRHLEPVADALRRYTLRHRLRQAWYGGNRPSDLVRDLGISHRMLAQGLAQPFFGSAWTKIEAISPVLQRRPVRFADIPAEIAEAEALLQRRVCPPEAMAAD